MSHVPKHLRNPRRSYDENGIEQPPATVANSRANKARGLLVFCECGHEGTLPFNGLHVAWRAWMAIGGADQRVR